ncbi:MAG: diadenylate cyclase CdaA [Acholeplasmataceae bacterium]
MIFGVPIWKFIVDFYIVWIFVYLGLQFVLTNKRMLGLVIAFIFVYGLSLLANALNLRASQNILDYFLEWGPLLILVLMSPDIRRAIEILFKADVKSEAFVMGSAKTKESVVDAAMALSAQKIGALITIEKHNTLDQFAERAVVMNSEISKELLLNIFTPLTPLHDGAVIIRGDYILCAGAYFVLSDNENFEKTMGSRHRAGLGISEITDSLTIIVSEETGSVSIAIEGIMLKINDRDKLMEYVNMFMK